MKNLKIKFGLFSLLAVLAASIFLTSCEQQEAIVPDTIEHKQSNESLSTDDTESVTFTLPERFDNMSEEELVAFFNSTSKEDILALSITISPQQVEARCDCSSWSYAGYSHCYTPTSWLPRRWSHLHKRYCTHGFFQYKYVAGTICR